MDLKTNLLAIKIYLQAIYLHFRYKQDIGDIYLAYTQFYGNYKIVKQLCERCYYKNVDFGKAYDDLMEVKIKLEAFAKRRKDTDVQDFPHIDDKKL